jgi:hypothetical protein
MSSTTLSAEIASLAMLPTELGYEPSPSVRPVAKSEVAVGRAETSQMVAD